MWNARAEQIPKLTVRVRFPSPAPKTKAQPGNSFRTLGRLVDVGFIPMPNYRKRGGVIPILRAQLH